MRKTFISSLLLALLTSASLSLTAAPATAPAAAMDTAAPISAMQADKVDLNKADVQTLQSALSGIGRAKAEAIVAYREANGAFASVDELLEVKGIGKALLDKNRDKLMIN